MRADRLHMVQFITITIMENMSELIITANDKVSNIHNEFIISLTTL